MENNNFILLDNIIYCCCSWSHPRNMTSSWDSVLVSILTCLDSAPTPSWTCWPTSSSPSCLWSVVSSAWDCPWLPPLHCCSLCQDWEITISILRIHKSKQPVIPTSNILERFVAPLWVFVLGVFADITLFWGHLLIQANFFRRSLTNCSFLHKKFKKWRQHTSFLNYLHVPVSKFPELCEICIAWAKHNSSFSVGTLHVVWLRSRHECCCDMSDWGSEGK